MSSATKHRVPARIARDQARYEALKKSLADLGWIRRGSVVRRFMPCGTAGCRCQADPPQLHGPYYQWTRKVGGKTVTVRLTEEEAKAMKEWISNGRQLNRTLRRLEALSLRITDHLLQCFRKP